MSVHVSMTVHDKSTLNFFIRHAAIWHKFNEKTLMIDVLDTCCALKSLIVLVSHAGHIWTLLLNAQRLFLIF